MKDRFVDGKPRANETTERERLAIFIHGRNDKNNGEKKDGGRRKMGGGGEEEEEEEEEQEEEEEEEHKVKTDVKKETQFTLRGFRSGT